MCVRVCVQIMLCSGVGFAFSPPPSRSPDAVADGSSGAGFCVDGFAKGIGEGVFQLCRVREVRRKRAPAERAEELGRLQQAALNLELGVSKLGSGFIMHVFKKKSSQKIHATDCKHPPRCSSARA
jgi:hypothetical protein